MKVLIATIFFVASVTAKGSGPYLPSGWRPEGAAFLLPSEVQKPPENPLKDTIFHENDASGSYGLKEYGPPKVDLAPQQISNQGLPDVFNEQTFFIDTKIETVETGAEVNAKEVSTVVETISAIDKSLEAAKIVTQSDIATVDEVKVDANEEAATEETTTEGKLLEVALEQENVSEDSAEQSSELAQLEVYSTIETFEQTEQSISVVPTVSIVEDKTDTLQGIVTTTESEIENENVSVPANILEVNIGSAFEEVVPIIVAEEKLQELVPTVVELAVEDNVDGGSNIVGSLNNFVQEVVTIQDETAQGVTETKTNQELFTFEQVPEGFLEYGPPGFKEYGPPGFKEYGPPGFKEYGPPKDVGSSDIKDEPNKVLENNELRKRRFSPKFKSSKGTY